ncbi:glycosyltransferase family 4 protein [Candidatus Laterigemmans baculatus]|uniref:glycosyltransferase family 4 protein n=1 Tax=Candidatus Laterigemmans baculatus TaxID=2770505 RepID=UPI0013DC8C5D|nr:glycosyltransferase family 1 protein [Candidatus Laterigemmans baculatus]
MTKIAINALFKASGGSLKNLQSLLRCWEQQGVLREHQVLLFASPYVARILAASPVAGLQVLVLPEADRGMLGRQFAEHVTLPKLLCDHQPDVLFCPGNTVPRGIRIPTTVVFQNAAPFSSHCGWRRVGLKSWLRFRILAHAVHRASRRAERIIVGSNDFADLLSTSLKLPRQRFTVIPRAVDRDLPNRQAPSGAPLQLPSRFLLCVSHLQPYKNIVELVEGFARLRDHTAMQDVQLLIAGGVYTGSRYREKIIATIERLGCSDRIQLLGDIQPADIPSLLARCELFAFPSTCENCPTALMEALSAGAVIASSDIGAMPEMAGDAAVYFDPYDPTSIAAAIERSMTDAELRRRLQIAARRRADQLDGHVKTATRTLRAILEAAVAEPSRQAA